MLLEDNTSVTIGVDSHRDEAPEELMGVRVIFCIVHNASYTDNALNEIELHTLSDLCTFR